MTFIILSFKRSNSVALSTSTTSWAGTATFHPPEQKCSPAKQPSFLLLCIGFAKNVLTGVMGIETNLEMHNGKNHDQKAKDEF